MTKLTSILMVLALAAGCRDKQANKQPSGSGASGSRATATSGSSEAADPKFVERLPAVGGGDTALLLHFTIGLVKLGADGTLHVAHAPAQAAPDPRTPADPFATSQRVQLGQLGEVLGLPPVVQRTESAYGVVETGSAAGSAATATATGSANDASANMNDNDIAFAQLGHPVAAAGAPQPPHRLTSAFALAHPNDVSGGVVVFADAQASAASLVDVLAQTGGFLAVRRDTQLGALSLAVDRHAPAPVAPNRPWVEVRLGASAGQPIEVERVPGAPVQVASIDKLPEAVKQLGGNAVDVLVGPKTTVQELVAAVEQLRAAGVIAIGLGKAADGGPEVAARGAQGPHVVAWDFFMHDVEQTAQPPFRAALDQTLESMRTCYQAAVAKTPDLAGTAQVEVFVAANAKVAAADATGVPPQIATCVVNAVKAATFPAPSTAGARITAKIAFVPR